MTLWQKRPDMVVFETDPYNAEPTRSALDGQRITPADTFYSRNHGPVPDVEPADWRLRVDGLVARPLELTLDDLQTRYPARSVVATLQCAGARRAAMTTIAPIPDEAPWGPCATSTAEWTGVALAEVLADAGLEPDAAHVAFTAPDVSRLPVPPETYGSSIPRGKATAPEVLLAWGMNGEPLPALHGGPLRVVVPGFIGARSVKWVTAITAQRAPSDNYFQAVAYRLLPADADPASRTGGLSLTSVALNSDILRPDDGACVAAGPVRVSGYAYAGDDRAVARVDVSVDEGRSWRQAELDPDPQPWAWSLWHITVDLPVGTHVVTVRAWDSTGATQPERLETVWNPKGYVNNAWGHVTLDVRDGGG